MVLPYYIFYCFLVTWSMLKITPQVTIATIFKYGSIWYQISYYGSFFHMAVLAFNRFHAVFFVFSYQRVWNKK